MRRPPDASGLRVLVAPDKFAGTLTAPQAAAAITEGWLEAMPEAVADQAPMADGGPGFLDALSAALGGRVDQVRATGPHGESVVARLLVVGSAGATTAYVEAADVCGLSARGPRRPWEATTAGLAPLLRTAVSVGATRVVVGIGGTASTDGGRGVVEALGSWPDDVELVAATDVAAPLLGEQGAARRFGPQKGADPATVARLEHRLADWAATTDGDPTAAGAGAGGGLGYGLALLGGHRVSGAALVADVAGLPARLAESDVVVTGEGRFDRSSLQGKVVAEVAARALATDLSCLVLAGEVLVSGHDADAAGVTGAWSVADLVGSAAASRARPREGLARLAAHVASRWVAGR